jgi:Protein of unknown function (DUF3047)
MSAAWRCLLFSVAWFGGSLCAGEPREIASFAQANPGLELPRGWQPLGVPNVKPNSFALVQDGGAVVLRVESNAAAGSASYALKHNPGPRPILTWRWKVDGVIARADLAAKSGDDFAARVYVFFDVPDQSLPIGARARMKMARLIYGSNLPTAALCYVWDNTHPPGTSVWNAYTDRVRMIVLESGPSKVNNWVNEARDVGADFRSAFGFEAPTVTGIALGNDTDQTGEHVVAHFGDFSFQSKP